MQVERKLQNWLRYGITLYAGNPALLEEAFYEEAQFGVTTTVADGLLVDRTKLWIPGEWAGGTLRFAGATFLILSNTLTTLTVAEDLSALDLGSYRIIPVDVSRALEVLARLANELPSRPLAVELSYNRIPQAFPAMTIRLQQDRQAQAYVGESLESSAEDGLESCYTFTDLTGSYLITIWTLNPLETIWLYTFLVNYAQRSMMQFATWGLSEVSVEGSDLDPSVESFPEQVYTRHLMLTGTRTDRALTQLPVEAITLIATVPQPAYAPLGERF